MLAIHLLIGCLMIAITVLFHAFALDRIMLLVERIGPTLFRHFRRLWKIPLVMILILLIFAALMFEMFLWACLYLWLDALHTMEEALYYSLCTYSTVGYGDIVLDQIWRILGGIQSANGLLLFGWSTAYIFEVMAKLYKQEEIQRIWQQR